MTAASVDRVADDMARQPSDATIADDGAETSPIFEGPERIVLGPTIGEGGMATVRLGMQASLGRTVAVKMARDDTPAQRKLLLQEARLTARLQHPNIAPVHDVVRSSTQELQIVLKRVEGVRWSAVMRDEATLRSTYGADDVLDWNLNVLVGVCNALAYAHQQGVVHRDIKPSNVMVGTFGEIYLLDWGIAAMWGDRREPDIAHVADTAIAGTLGYMAPEQLEGQAEAIGPRTDVYLLGATLHEILGGSSPHASTDEVEARLSPRERVVPTLPAHAPRELAELVERALRVEPNERPASAEEFRQRIEAYRRHRGSHLLAEGAAAKLATADVDADDVDRLLTEAELGFLTALEAWPGNERAAEGVRLVAIRRVERALATELPQLARQWLDRVGDPPESLARRVRRACEADERARAEGARAAWHLDPTVGLLLRRKLLAIFAPFWVAGWVAFAIWPVTSPRPLLAFLAVCALLGVGFVLTRGLSTLNNQMNKTNILGGAAALAGCFAWGLACELRDLGVPLALTGFLLVNAVVLTLVTLVLDKRAAAPAVLTAATFAAAVRWPSHSHVALAVAAVGIAISTVGHNLILLRQMRRRELAPDSRAQSRR